jgi:organic hydroperoxide reductase OsmC/OhrA
MSAIPLHYTTTYRWTGEAEAGESTIEGAPLLAVGSPHSTERYSPEHLLVVATETCLANYVLVIAQMSQLEVKGYCSSAEGELVQEGEVEYRFARVLIRPELTVAPGKEEQARRILEKAHQLCLVARSLSCPVEMEPTVRTQ